jgi:hypothetical protein
VLAYRLSSNVLGRLPYQVSEQTWVHDAEHRFVRELARRREERVSRQSI